MTAVCSFLCGGLPARHTLFRSIPKNREEKMTDITVTKPRITVSHSEVESYLRCERQWYYGYGLEIQRISESDSLFRGTLGHAALEVFFNALLVKQEENEYGLTASKEDLDDAAQSAMKFVLNLAPTYPVLVAEIVECLTFFFMGYPFMGWKILGVEYQDVLPVTEELAMPFVIDLIAQDPFGKVWIIDHKFMYDFISDRDAELMPQLSKYAVGMKALGHTIDKTGYSVLRYRSLKNPTVESKYLFKEVYLSPERQQRTITEQVIVSDRIQAAKKLPLEVLSQQSMRTANKMVCNSCSFRSLCVAELNDWQPDLILNGEYKPKVRRDFEISATKQIEAKDEYA